MENPQLAIRSLKGAPLSILLILQREQKPLQQKALMMWTGYSDKTIAAALQLLTGMEAVEFTGRQTGWALTQNGKKLWQQLVSGDEEVVEGDEAAETAVTD